MRMLNRGIARVRRGSEPFCQPIEPLESRRVLSASVLSEASEPAADAQDVMASFDAFLRDQAARQYAAMAIDAPYPARAPGAPVTLATVAAPTGGA